MFGKQFHHFRLAAPWIVPDPHNKFGVESFAAAFRHIGPSSISKSECPHYDSPETEPARQVEENNRVALPNSDFQRSGKVAVDDPRISFDQLRYNLQPLVTRRLYPASVPKQFVEMMYFEI